MKREILALLEKNLFPRNPGDLHVSAVTFFGCGQQPPFKVIETYG